MGLIVWVIQAVNYFDFVSEDGHGLKVYFLYSIFNFPKILNRILPFMYFISLFYVLIKYENNNELYIFWINGITKLQFTNVIIFFSIIMMILQIILSSYISPYSQLKARTYLKNSNSDFFNSLIKEDKFTVVGEGLTIYINKINEDKTYNELFIEDQRNSSHKMIYAKKGILINNEHVKLFKLYEGRVINKINSKINTFNFNQIDFSLNNLISKTITVPKIQEIDLVELLGCLNILNVQNTSIIKCDENLKKNIKQELLKRYFKPFYIPLITILCSFLIIHSKNKINYKKNINTIFISIFLIIIISEASLRYSSISNYLTLSYGLLPLAIFLISYSIFIKNSKNV